MNKRELLRGSDYTKRFKQIPQLKEYPDIGGVLTRSGEITPWEQFKRNREEAMSGVDFILLAGTTERKERMWEGNF